MSKPYTCHLEQIWKQLVQRLDLIPTILDSLNKSLPALLNVDLLGLKGFSSVGVTLRHEYDRSSGQLNEIARNVIEYIIVAESLLKMADDKDQMERIRAEVRKQRERGTTHFDRQDIVRFSELNEFLTELLERVRNIDILSGRIEEQSRELYSNLFSRNEAAEIKATSKENSAWLRKVAFGAAAVTLFGVATGGVGFGIGAAIAGTQGTALVLSTLAAVGGGGGFAARNMSRKCSHEEAKFCKIKRDFESLKHNAIRLEQVTSDIQRYTRLLKTNIEACFICDQPPLLRQIPRSLEELFRLERVNFNKLRKRAESIDVVIAAGFKKFPACLCTPTLPPLS